MLQDKNHQNFAKAIEIHVSRECFLTFLINFLFLKILAFLAQRNWKFGQKVIFLAFFGFKNKKLMKKVRKHFLDTRI